jgi:enoyl-CoA hydratase
MKYLEIDEAGDTGILRINRPDALNALNQEVLEDFCSFFHNKGQALKIKVLILTGKGEKAFCAGADVKEMQEMTHKEILHLANLGHQVASFLENAPFVTIACLNGFALGGGLEMALGCDFIYASKDAKIGLPEVSLGLIPGFGGTQRLSRTIGSRMAKEMIFTGEILSAETAKNLGLVNKVCQADTLLQSATDTAKRIIANSFFAVQQAKLAIHHGVQLPLTDACTLEKQMFAVTFSSNDRKEGIQAFMEKRTPNFT